MDLVILLSSGTNRIVDKPLINIKKILNYFSKPFIARSDDFRPRDDQNPTILSRWFQSKTPSKKDDDVSLDNIDGLYFYDDESDVNESSGRYRPSRNGLF